MDQTAVLKARIAALETELYGMFMTDQEHIRIEEERLERCQAWKAGLTEMRFLPPDLIDVGESGMGYVSISFIEHPIGTLHFLRVALKDLPREFAGLHDQERAVSPFLNPHIRRGSPRLHAVDAPSPIVTVGA